MKVLHLTTHLNTGGITTYILRLAEPLAKRGVQLSVLSSGGEWQPAYEADGVPAYTFPIKTKSELHPKLYFALPKAAELIHKEKFDLLHAHTRVTQVMSFFLSKMTGVPVVTTCHGFYKRRLGRVLLPAWGERVIGISQQVGENLIDYFKVPAERVKVINNGVNIKELDATFGAHPPKEARKTFGFEETDIVIGIVSRLVRDKGHEYLIQSIAELKKNFPRIRLLIVGEGREKIFLEKTVIKSGLANMVRFTGNLRDVTLALAAMDIFAFPAVWREGFGLSIIEAMACGKPVIVSNIWALNTLIKDGVTGILVEPKNITALTKAISNLIEDKHLYASLSQNARAKVEELFSIERMADDLVGLYHETLGRPAVSRL